MGEPSLLGSRMLAMDQEMAYREEERKSRRKRSRSKEREDRHRHSERKRSRSREKRSRREEGRKSSRRSPSSSPSPPPRRRKKNSKWDKPPDGFETAEVHGTGFLTPQQARQARRLFISNLPDDVDEEQIAEFFNETLLRAEVTKYPQENPISAVQKKENNNFAFIEFHNHEDCTQAFKMERFHWNGKDLIVKRPKDYTPVSELQEILNQNLAQMSGTLALPSTISTNVQEGPNKIFVGGLPSYLNEEQVKELVQSFGLLKSFNLVKDSNTGVSKGFAFFEYMDPDVTDRACQGLNGMKLGEKTVLVQRANIGAKHPTQNPHTKSILVNPTACNFLNLGMPIAAATKLLNIDINDPGPPTRILQLANIVSAKDLYNLEDYNEIMEDIREECSRFGPIVSIHIPQPPPPKNRDDIWSASSDEPKLPEEIKISWGLGRIYIEFESKEDCQKAHDFLAGRRYNGRTVLTGYYSEDRFANKNFAPDYDEEKAIADEFRREKEAKEKKEREELLKEAEQDDEYYTKSQ